MGVPSGGLTSSVYPKHFACLDGYVKITEFVTMKPDGQEGTKMLFDFCSFVKNSVSYDDENRFVF